MNNLIKFTAVILKCIGTFKQGVLLKISLKVIYALNQMHV